MPLTHLESHLQGLIIRDITHNNARTLIRNMAMTVLAVLTTAFIAYGITIMGFPSPESLSVLFVLPVLYSAIVQNLLMAMLSSILSVLAYNFVLLPPVWHIGLTDPGNSAKLAILAFVAFVSSALASRIRLLARESLNRERVLSGVYALSQDMLGISNLNEMRHAAEIKLSDLLEAKASIILKHETERFDTAVHVCMESGLPTGKDGKLFAYKHELYLPLPSAHGPLGVLHLTPKDEQPHSTRVYESKVLVTLTAQTANALEKAFLAEGYERQKRQAEKERFLTVLLSSVSHDFRTPLVTVVGAFDVLQNLPIIQEKPTYYELVKSGLGEAQKLNRFISNLLEISQLETGIKDLHRDTIHLRDVLASALKSLQPLIGQQNFLIKIPNDFPLLNVNSALIELTLLNLLENAIKYGPAAGEIQIIASALSHELQIDVQDQGKGISESEREAIFVKFYRSENGDSKIAGTGLGLYICREIIAAHDGTIAVVDNGAIGTCIRITLPKSAIVDFELNLESEDV